MNIGMISTWFERGAAYVTRQYAELLEKKGHKTFVYCRGEQYGIGDPKWDLPNVTWGKKLYDTNIDKNHFFRWIRNNRIDVLFFNEQREMNIVLKTKREFPNVKIGTYIDYYTQDTIKSFEIYDFLICNTKRHYSVFSWHPQCFYIPWGTDTTLFCPQIERKRSENNVVFFHSAGMSNRKGTDALIRVFIQEGLYKQSRLVVHTQLPLEKIIGEKIENIEQYNIEIIEKTVTAPGLYHLGDVYVYPTTLDGLGLTLYEALSMGMPIITTNCAPMNEIVNNDIGRLVTVEKYTCRWDAYYWPLSYVNLNSLKDALQYYIERRDELTAMRHVVREYALSHCDWYKNGDVIDEAFTKSRILPVDTARINKRIRENRQHRIERVGKAAIDLLPGWIQKIIVAGRN